MSNSSIEAGSASTDTTSRTQVYRVYIKATADAIWTAITDPEWTNRYGYTGYANYDLRPGGAYTVRPNAEFKAAVSASGYECPDPVIDGEVIEADAPHRLVTTWRMLMDPTSAAEGFTRLTHEIKQIEPGFCRLTVTHELAASQPATAAIVAGTNEDVTGDGGGGGGGHAWVLSDLKSLLETGSTLSGQAA
jgi:uncharacterized protein YndB with AHSA1/START domain